MLKCLSAKTTCLELALQSYTRILKKELISVIYENTDVWIVICLDFRIATKEVDNWECGKRNGNAGNEMGMPKVGEWHRYQSLSLPYLSLSQLFY